MGHEFRRWNRSVPVVLDGGGNGLEEGDRGVSEESEWRSGKGSDDDGAPETSADKEIYLVPGAFSVHAFLRSEGNPRRFTVNSLSGLKSTGGVDFIVGKGIGV